jgi:hypothetical protein
MAKTLRLTIVAILIVDKNLELTYKKQQSSAAIQKWVADFFLTSILVLFRWLVGFFEKGGGGLLLFCIQVIRGN